jgi:hypothetical protein
VTNKKISELSSASALSGSELIEVVQAGGNAKVALDVLLDGPPKNGVTVNYTDGMVSEVLLYTDSAKTDLYRRYVMNRTGGQVTSVEVRDDASSLLETVNLAYTGSQITGATVT